MIRMHHDAGEAGLEIAQARAAMIDVMLARLFDYALDSYRRAHGELPSPVCPDRARRLRPARAQPAERHRRDVPLPVEDEAGGREAVAGAPGQRGPLPPLGLRPEGRPFHAHHRRGLRARRARTSRRRPRCSSRASSPARPRSTRRLPRPTATSPPRRIPRATSPPASHDQATRRAKYGDTVFLQEPDIKNGVGGLRDYQNALWMARVKLGIERMEELAHAELPPPQGAGRLPARLQFPPARPQRAALHQQAPHRPPRPRHAAARRPAPRLPPARHPPARRGLHGGLLPRRRRPSTASPRSSRTASR